MNEAMIGLITGLLAAMVALGTAVWTNAKTERREGLSQRAQWTHDRRRDAYLAFSKSARAFVPLTEETFLLVARAEAASATSPTSELPSTMDGEQVTVLVQYETWHDALMPEEVTEPGDEWKKAAPTLLQDLTAAYDGVNLEGPPDIARVAYSVVTTAHRLFTGMPLFEMEAKSYEEIDEDGRHAGPSARDLFNTEVSAYFSEFREFRRDAKALLAEGG